MDIQDVICKKCGSVNSITVKQNGVHRSAYCLECGEYIKHITKFENMNDFTLYFGKYKGRQISTMTHRDEASYLRWALENIKFTQSQRIIIENHLSL